jgi:hypothetical protein
MRKGLVILTTFLIVSAASATQMEVNPWDFVSGKARFGAVVRIDSTQSVSEELVAAGALVEVRAPVPQDASLFGAHLRLFSDVAGDLVAAGAVVEVKGEIGGKAEIAGASIYLDGTFADSLDAGGAVIFLSGHVKGPVILSAAEIYIEESAIIEDTLRYSTGKLHVAEGARLNSGAVEFIPEPKEKPEVEKGRPKRTFGGWFTRLILRFLMLAGAGLFLSLVFPRHFKEVTGRILVNPGLSVLTGGLALVALPLVVFLAVLLFVSILGIGAGFFFVALYAIGLLFSALYAGTALGRLILSKAQKGKEVHIVLSMLLGTFIAAVLCHIPYAGWLFRLGSFIFGFGALLISFWLAIKPSSKLKPAK